MYVHLSESGGSGGGKDTNVGATAAALFPCLIYYPGMASVVELDIILNVHVHVCTCILFIHA